MKGSNSVALGYDEGSVIIKVGLSVEATPHHVQGVREALANSDHVIW